MMRIEDVVTEAVFGRIEGRDKRDYYVWKNPTHPGFLNLIRQAPHGSEGMRAMMTSHDLYFWQSLHVLHGDFTRQTGIDGVRIMLRPAEIAVNQEVIAMPFEFPWIFDDDDPDLDERQVIVERWLHANSRLTTIYTQGFNVNWYM
jgi:hypothetical protein